VLGFETDREEDQRRVACLTFKKAGNRRGRKVPVEVMSQTYE